MRTSPCSLLLSILLVACADHRTESLDAGTVDSAGPDARFDGTAADQGVGDEREFDASADGGLVDADTDGRLGDATVDGGVCVTEDRCDGEGHDEDCDGSSDEGCGECAVAHVSCASGCCAVPEVQIAPLGANPFIEVDGRDNIWVSYTRKYAAGWRTNVARYNAETSAWSDREVGGAGAGSERSVVRADDTGSVHVLFAARGGTPHYAVSGDGGDTWAETGSLSGVVGLADTVDLAVASDGTPHVVYGGHYATLEDGVWRTESLAAIGGYPRIVLGFADRPAIVYETSILRGGEYMDVMQLALFDGATWRYEDFDETSSEFGVGRTFFNRFEVEIDELGELSVYYTRAVEGASAMVHATRSVAGVWNQVVLPLSEGQFANALAHQADGRLAFVSDGLFLHQDTGAGWSSESLPEQQGDGAAVKRAGDFLYVAYSSRMVPDALMFARVSLR